MKKFTKYSVLCLLGILLIPLCQAAPKDKPKPAPKPAKTCVAMIHVIKGCSACETMQTWLQKGGVQLEVSNVQQGNYQLYPTVLYSDKFVDNGERMYKQQVEIPKQICVVSCSIGME